MELYEAMRTTFACRDFTDDPLPDEVIYEMIENARFSPSGGNRQGNRVIIVRDMATRQRLSDLTVPVAKRYRAQMDAGESPWSAYIPTKLTPEQIEATPAPVMLTEPLLKSSVVLVVCVDLKVVAATDQYLDRVGVIGGASIYPFAWSLLLAARQNGFAGTITTLPIAHEPEIKTLLNIPDDHAVCAVMPFGRPVRQLTKLKRRPVEEIATRERFDGDVFTQG